MISNDPEKAVYMELVSQHTVKIKLIEIELKLIDLLVFGYIAEISGPFKIKQTLVKQQKKKTSKIRTAGGIFYYSEPLNNVLIEDLGLCWTTPHRN